MQVLDRFIWKTELRIDGPDGVITIMQTRCLRSVRPSSPSLPVPVLDRVPGLDLRLGSALDQIRVILPITTRGQGREAIFRPRLRMGVILIPGVVFRRLPGRLNQFNIKVPYKVGRVDRIRVRRRPDALDR
jgi:hypothetical protein